MEKHPLHLKNPELHTSPEVKRAVERKDRETGKKISNDPALRIEVYTDRLENIFLNPNEKTRKRNLELFRDKIYNALLIKPENFPESYFDLQKRIARERGQAVEEIPENVRDQMKAVAIEDQKASLDAWMDYLTSDDAVYPAWFKYYVWKNIIKLSQFDKERGEFKKRTDTTVATFPDIYREPLAQIADIYEKVKENNKNLKDPEIQDAFSKKFPALYAELIQKSLLSSMENREEIKGEWVKYEQGKEGEAEKLFGSLEGKGTGWCTAGKSTANSQINSGDFYVYYTNDSNNQPTQPRLAIRMTGDKKIAEVRGVLPQQNVESMLQETLDKKLDEFGSEAEEYKKKSENMRYLTALEHRIENKEPLTEEDLSFLYEINSPIEGFGYDKDPRIAEIRSKRNEKEDLFRALPLFAEIDQKTNENLPCSRDELIFLYEIQEKNNIGAFNRSLITDLQEKRREKVQIDAPIYYECSSDEVATKAEDINEKTRIYVGTLNPGIFKKFSKNIEHIVTKFPEKEIKTMDIKIGEMSTEQLMQKTGLSDAKDIVVPKKMFLSSEFKISENQGVKLVVITGYDLGIKGETRTDKIFEQAIDLGLDLCPPDIGPNLRIQYQDQPENEDLTIAMKGLDVSFYSQLYVFGIYRSQFGSKELGMDARDFSSKCYPDKKFVFCMPGVK